MKNFIECSVGKESIVGQGHYEPSGPYIHIITYCSFVFFFFNRLFDDNVTVRRLGFNNEKRFSAFSGPFKIIDFDGPDKEGKCNIYLKDIDITSK